MKKKFFANLWLTFHSWSCMSKELQIRNSTVDFLVFTRDAGEDGIEVRVQNGDVWLTQKAISQLFDVDRSVVTKHLSNIFKEGDQL